MRALIVAPVVVRTVVSVVENAHARPRLQEPPSLEIGGRLRLGRHPFLERFLEPCFSSMELDVVSKMAAKLILQF